MRARIATVLQAAGVGCAVCAGFGVSRVVGLVVAAVGLLAFGVAVERGGKR